MSEWLEYRDPEALSDWLEASTSDHESGGEAPCDGELASGQGCATPPSPVAGGFYNSEHLLLGEISEPAYLIKALGLGPGRPTALWGSPGSGKTLTAIGIALAVASGAPAFGHYPVDRRGKVLIFSYDMGINAVRLRIRQVANGMGLGIDDLEDHLAAWIHPRVALSDPKALRDFAKLLEGFDLAILDNARGAIKGIDENDSRFGDYLTTYGKAADAVGCVPMYLHHTRKDSGSMSLASGRGTGAILASSGTVWGLEGDGTDPRELKMMRMHDCAHEMSPTTYIQRDMIPGPGELHTAGEPSIKLSAHAEHPGRTAAAAAKAATAIETIRQAVRDNPGIGARALREACAPINHDRLDLAIEKLTRVGELKNRGTGNSHEYYLNKS